MKEKFTDVSYMFNTNTHVVQYVFIRGGNFISSHEFVIKRVSCDCFYSL